MVMSVASNLLSDNVRILKDEVSRTAYQGVAIAIISIVIATLLVCFYHTGGISIEGIIQAQKNSFALWVLDTIPFIFGFWGQYLSKDKESWPDMMSGTFLHFDKNSKAKPLSRLS